MSSNKHYLIANRHGPSLDKPSAEALEKFLSTTDGVGDSRRTSIGRFGVSAPEEQMRDFQRDNPSLVVEEDEALRLFGMPGLPPADPCGETKEVAVVVRDAGTDKPVADATVYGFGRSVSYKAVTNKKGEAVLKVREPVLQRILISARHSYWSQQVESVEVDPSQQFNCKLRPLLASGCRDWAKLAMGFNAVSGAVTGRGVRIGIIDSGINAQIDQVRIAGGYNTLDGESTDAWNVDEKGHGTHIAGIIGATPASGVMQGGAPDAELYSVKVFPGGHIVDLVEGIEWCIREKMDIICLSLGIERPSQVLAAAIRDAYDRGITCVAAVGNDRGLIAAPASYPTTIGVGALGRFGTFPEDSGHALAVSNALDRRGGFFVARFSNFGLGVDCCAPGVGILSQVPEGYAAWDGTSMAGAQVCACVALILEAFPQLRIGDPSQPEAIRSMLQQSSFDLGLPPYLQGAGMPLCPRALGMRG